MIQVEDGAIDDVRSLVLFLSDRREAAKGNKRNTATHTHTYK